MLRLMVRNHPGVMSHVCGLFSRRSFNLEGIICVPIGDGARSEMLLLVKDDARLEQVILQLAETRGRHRGQPRARDAVGIRISRRRSLSSRMNAADIIERINQERGTAYKIIGQYDSGESGAASQIVDALANRYVLKIGAGGEFRAENAARTTQRLRGPRIPRAGIHGRRDRRADLILASARDAR